MTTFRITVDVTMSGDIYVEADSMEEAKRKINSRSWTHSDLNGFHYVGREIVDCEEDACS